VTTAWVMMQLVEFLEDRGRRAEADETIRQALAITQRQNAGTNRATMAVQASLLNDLSILMENRGNRTQAVALAGEALHVARQLPGTPGRSPTVAAYLHWLGNLAIRSGDPDKAEPLLNESAAIYRERYGDNHWDRANPLASLAQVYSARGDRAKAESSWRE